LDFPGFSLKNYNWIRIEKFPRIFSRSQQLNSSWADAIPPRSTQARNSASKARATFPRMSRFDDTVESLQGQFFGRSAKL